MDMETADEDDEDGQITREEQEEERERRILGKHNPEEEKITVLDLEKIRLTRDALAKNCLSPWFEDYVKGVSRAWQARRCLSLQPFSHVRRLGSVSHRPGGQSTRLPHLRDIKYVLSRSDLHPA